jgi:hypothetical protein
MESKGLEWHPPRRVSTGNDDGAIFPSFAIDPRGLSEGVGGAVKGKATLMAVPRTSRSSSLPCVRD